MSAPGLFAGAALLGWLGGWLVIRLVYNQRLAHQGDMITNLRAVLEEKLPTSFLPPPPRKRSKLMSFGLVLIFVGLGAAAAGALLVSLDRSPAPVKPMDKADTAPKTLAIPTAPIAQPPVLPALPQAREFTDRTPRELLALYDGRTPLQANPLIEPFKGKWIKASGKILNLIPDGMPGASIAVLRDGERIIECRLGPQWEQQVFKLNKDEDITIIGKISPHQNGSQLYLTDCEIA